ncbi:elongation factor P maturation arginine rhamnosyltransferase EarP [Pelomonas sp. SE-A7]|uniref:elongation factor P maturation arginine rhamnosyltransferase EarP n=1 Tax=Pelomonas sp. SE-A7 TaxID=3054953 RepID=UPI00259D2048|nr:elongation factor P maturation arginine rhamnosyltransferase EarP [Pelomonas sp. SE-A7]MDM4764805.1 elongation factor P maturation arginine rhamnosyltransferase EarP [Pelomonas sp. SE-A7]
MQWDLFCRVIDNYGDVGVCWRLARDLAARGETVRLWLDDARALDWMAGDSRPDGIQVRAWNEADSEPVVGDVVIESFGCELPAAFVGRMAARQPAPRWINLEYLSAESYVERSHGLHSPQFTGPGAGLSKRFFYPGFTPRTGGLLREPGMMAEQSSFDQGAWLAAQGIEVQPGERLVSLFAYKLWPELLPLLAEQPTLVLACPGTVQQQLAEQAMPPGLRCQALPFLRQPDYDRLLWRCELNLVRGEDSFVRAQWAGKPFVWQIYEQDDGAHGPKLEAFLDRYLADADPMDAVPTRQLWRAWNGLSPWPSALPVATSQALRWRDQLLAQTDLASQLLSFVAESG